MTLQIHPLCKVFFPSDKLPIINTYPAGLIANAHHHDQPGTHWVAIYFDSPQETEFFDGYDMVSLLKRLTWIPTF